MSEAVTYGIQDGELGRIDSDDLTWGKEPSWVFNEEYDRVVITVYSDEFLGTNETDLVLSYVPSPTLRDSNQTKQESLEKGRDLEIADSWIDYYFEPADQALYDEDKLELVGKAVWSLDGSRPDSEAQLVNSILENEGYSLAVPSEPSEMDLTPAIPFRLSDKEELKGRDPTVRAMNWKGQPKTGHRNRFFKEGSGPSRFKKFEEYLDEKRTDEDYSQSVEELVENA